MFNKVLVAMLIVSMVGFIAYMERQPEKKVVAITPTATPTPTPYIFNEDRLFSLIQTWKQEKAMYTYKKSDFLCSVANTRLEETKKNWSHNGFSSDRFCNGDCYLGENLAKDWSNEEETLKEWLNSSSHRTVLEKNYTHSCLKCEGDRCVQIFGYY